MSLQKITALACHSFVYGVRGQTPTLPSDFSGTANRGLSLIALFMVLLGLLFVPVLHVAGTYFLNQVPA